MTTQTADSVRSHRIGPDGVVVLRVHDGDIRLRGAATDMATIRATDGRSLESLEIETGEQSLTVRSRSGLDVRGIEFLGFDRRERGRGRDRVKDLELEIPAGATVIVEGASADVDVQGMHGDQRYRSASGDLVLADVRGSLTIEAVSGDIRIATDGPASVNARTVSGDLDLRAESLGELHATTTSGDLRITGRFDGDGPYAIETVSGDATVEPLNDIRVEAKTIAGDIESDLPARRDVGDGRRALVIGAGGPTITFRSTSGDLRIVAPAASTPAVPVMRLAAPRPPTPPTSPAPIALPEAAIAASAGEARASADDTRLDVLRALERGEIDVAEAGRRLEALDRDQPIEAEEAGTPAEDHDDA